MSWVELDIKIVNVYNLYWIDLTAINAAYGYTLKMTMKILKLSQVNSLAWPALDCT